MLLWSEVVNKLKSITRINFIFLLWNEALYCKFQNEKTWSLIKCVVDFIHNNTRYFVLKFHIYLLPYLLLLWKFIIVKTFFNIYPICFFLFCVHVIYTRICFNQSIIRSELCCVQYPCPMQHMHENSFIFEFNIKMINKLLKART